MIRKKEVVHPRHQGDQGEAGFGRHNWQSIGLILEPQDTTAISPEKRRTSYAAVAATETDHGGSLTVWD